LVLTELSAEPVASAPPAKPPRGRASTPDPSLPAARRQYDAVELENRLVARSLERLWEKKLRRGEEIE
jgi:hypothetical protein